MRGNETKKKTMQENRDELKKKRKIEKINFWKIFHFFLWKI